MCNFYIFIKFLIIFLVSFHVCGEDPMIDIHEIPEELISDLYSQYKNAVEADDTFSLRRLQKQDREFKIHVKKLKNVNGFKIHNLLLEEVKSAKNPIIYINNPVESKISKTYLTLDEFKKALTDRVEKQRKEFIFQKKIKLKSINKTVLITRADLTTTTELYPGTIAKLKDLNVNESIFKEVNETDATLIGTTNKNTTKNNSDTLIISTTPAEAHSTTNININTNNGNISLQNSIKSPNISTINDPVTTISDRVFPTDTITTSNLDIRTEDSKNEDSMTTTINGTDYITVQKPTITLNSEISNTIEPTSEINIDSYNDTVTTSKLDATNADGKTEDFFTKANVSNQGNLREGSTETSSIVTTTSTKRRKSTLGRPLVFMGGYN